MSLIESLTPAELAYFEEHFPYEANKDIAEHLHIPVNRVSTLARKLRLVKDGKALSERRSRSAHDRVVENRFRRSGCASSEDN